MKRHGVVKGVLGEEECFGHRCWRKPAGGGSEVVRVWVARYLCHYSGAGLDEGPDRSVRAKGDGRVCVCARACDAGPRGRGRNGHREPQGLYDGGVVVRNPGVGAGCGLAGCQVPGGGEAAEGREEERVQPRCPSPAVASVGLACRNRRSRQVARRDDRWLPETARQGQGRTGTHLLSVLSAYGIWLEPPLLLSDGPDCLAPHSPVLRGERGGRGRRSRTVKQYRPRRSPNTIIGPRRKRCRAPRVEGRGRRSESTHTRDTFHKRAAGEAMEQIKTFRREVGGGRRGRRGIPGDGIRTDTTIGYRTRSMPGWGAMSMEWAMTHG